MNGEFGGMWKEVVVS